MRPLYAVQFEISRADGASPPTLGAEVLQRVVWWITEWYSNRLDVHVDLNIPSAAFSPVFGHDLEAAQDASPSSDVRHSVVNWSYPDENDGNLFWNSRVEIGEFDHRVEFSFQISIESVQYVIAPVEFCLRRPRIVGALLSEFRCTCGDMELSLSPREVGVEQIGEFVAKVLKSRTRRLPIIVVSRTTATEAALIDPVRVADRLAGVAETYFLSDKWAGFGLTDSLGKAYSCYNGAVRVYWPDFDPNRSSFSPVYVPERLLQVGERFLDDLFQRLAGISAFRHVRGPVTADAIEHLQAERLRETEKLRAAAKDRGDLNELLDLASQENDELIKQRDRLREENDSLKASLDLAHENFRAMRQDHGVNEPATSGAIGVEGGQIASEPRSLEEAVATAKKSFGATLVIQESAITSAKDSPFRQFSKAYQALLAMHEVCLYWRDSLRNGTPMGTFETAFERKGFEYKPRESMTAKGKWGDEYLATYRDQRVSIEPHLALGKGGPDTCLRIHFYVDEDERKFVVAHVGRHKTNTRS